VATVTRADTAAAATPPEPPAAPSSERLLRAGVAVGLAAVLVQTTAHLVDAFAFDYRYEFLDANSEQTAFSWASSSATFAAAFCVALLALTRPGLPRWLVALALVLAFFSLDDMLAFHERVSRATFATDLGLPKQSASRLFPVLWLPTLAYGFLGLFKLARESGRRVRRALEVGLACLIAAIAAELFPTVFGLEGVFEFHGTADGIEVAFEEGVELFGWILIAAALAAAVCETVARRSADAR